MDKEQYKSLVLLSLHKYASSYTDVPIVFPTYTGFSSDHRNQMLLKGKARKIMNLLNKERGTNRGTVRIHSNGDISLINTKDDPAVRGKYLSTFVDSDVAPVYEAYSEEKPTNDQKRVYESMLATNAVLDALSRASKLPGRVTPLGVYVPGGKNRRRAAVMFNADKDPEHGWAYVYDDGKYVTEGTQDIVL